MTPKLFGREPQAITLAVNALVALLSAFIFHFTPEVTGSINGFTQAAMAVWVGVIVHDGNLVTIMVGFGKAALSLVMGFGIQVDAIQQGAIVTALEMVLTVILRPQIVAPVDANNNVRTQLEADKVIMKMNRLSPVIALIGAITLIASAPMVLTSCDTLTNQANSQQTADELGALQTRAFDLAMAFIDKWAGGLLTKAPGGGSMEDQFVSRNSNSGIPEHVLREQFRRAKAKHG